MFCFTDETMEYCESLTDVPVYYPDENQYMPEPYCQRLIDAREQLSPSCPDDDDVELPF